MRSNTEIFSFLAWGSAVTKPLEFQVMPLTSPDHWLVARGMRAMFPSRPLESPSLEVGEEEDEEEEEEE